jgi:SOS-response transcriptional repressor LexA
MTTLPQRVSGQRQALGLSQAELGRRVGMSQQAIADIEAGRVSQPRRLVQIARVLHVDPGWLAGEEPQAAPAALPAARPPMHADLPVIGIAMGGSDATFELNGQVAEYVMRPACLMTVGDAYALYVTGESMEPRYFAGEIVYINPHRPPSPGDFVVLELRDGRGMVKRLVRRTADAVVLAQYNPPSEIEIPRRDIVRLHRIVQSGDP